jgi:uncharacterized protein involved in outer membrane biogenesis
MMKKKLLFWIAGGLIGVILLAVVIVFLMLNSIVRKAVADSATQGLKVQTTVGAAAVSPFSGNLALSEMAIGSPEGFTAPNVFTLGGVSVAVQYKQLFGQPVQVSNIRITKPKLVIEQAGGKLNVLELVNNLDKPSSSPPPEGAKKEPVKLVIDQLDLEGAEVEIRAGIPGLDKPIHLTLPTISVQNIGNAEGSRNGEEIGRVVGDLMQLLAQRAAESDAVPPEVRQLLKLDLNKIKDQAIERANIEVEKAKGRLDKEVTKGLDKLLGGKKKGDK